MVGVPCSCALLGGFAVGARVSLPWQHTRVWAYSLIPCKCVYHRTQNVSECLYSLVASLNLAEQFEFVWLLLMIEIILLMASCCGLEIILWPENTTLQVGACWQHREEVIGKWEEGKKWQKRVETLRAQCRDKDAEIEKLKKNNEMLKRAVDRSGSPCWLSHLTLLQLINSISLIFCSSFNFMLPLESVASRNWPVSESWRKEVKKRWCHWVIVLGWDQCFELNPVLRYSLAWLRQAWCSMSND